MPIVLKNNAFGFLAAGISNTDTGIQLQPGDGGNFPNVGSNEYFYATIQSISGAGEIVKVVGRTSDALTVVRAQEGTSALSFAAGSRVELRVTAQSVLDAIYDNAANIGAASEAAPGIVALATTPQAQALASAVVALTPARLADAFKGANQSLAANGYQKLPGGLIIQWGSVFFFSVSAFGNPMRSTMDATFIYPISFPNAALAAFTTNTSGLGGNEYTTTIEYANASSLVVRAYRVVGANDTVMDDFSTNILVIGY